MCYYAKFESRFGKTFRFDTRIYLNENAGSRTDGKCVAAIVGKNPGSASSTTIGTWGNLELSGDKMLPSIRNIFIKAYKLAGKTIPKNAFVQVWNLFYLCDKNLDSAIKSADKISTALLPACPGEESDPRPRIVWFAWGGNNDKLNGFKKRFLKKKKPVKAFFYNHQTKTVSVGVPRTTDFAKHTQGLRQQTVIEHLAGIL